MATTLKAVLEKLDELPEQLHEFYTEQEGKFYLNVEEVESHPAAKALQGALEAQKAARKKAAEEIAKLKERLAKVPDNFDPTELDKLRNQVSEMTAKIEEYEMDPAKKTPPDTKHLQELAQARRMLEQKITGMEKAHAAELAKQEQILAKKEAFIRKLMVEEELSKGLLDVGVNKSLFRGAQAMLAPMIKIEEEDDGYRVFVPTDTGDLDIPKFLADWSASDEGKAFIPPPKGADAAGTKQQKSMMGDIKNPWHKDHFNRTEQGKILRTDRNKAVKLAAAAGVKLPPP